MNKDYEYGKPNFVIFCDEKDTDIAKEALASMYQFKEKGTHYKDNSLYLKDYWEVVRPGLIAGKMRAISRVEMYRRREGNGRYFQMIDKLNSTGIRWEYKYLGKRD